MLEYTSGDIFDGEFKDGLFRGYGMKILKNGTILEGN